MKKLIAAASVALTVWTILVSGTSAYDERNLILGQLAPLTGMKYRPGAEGPTRFDCSGLVFYVFSEAGLVDRIGGKRMRAREYQAYQRRAGALFTDAKLVEVGDLAYWGNPAVHVGIVTRVNYPPRHPGKPNVFVTSALSPLGVRELRIDLITAHKPFSGFGHVGLNVVPDPTPTPSPTPSVTPSPTVVPTDSPAPSESPMI